MHQLSAVIAPTAAVAAGGIIGVGFGMLQGAALRQNEARQQAGKLNNGWTIMPGSGVRVFYLLLVLVLIQILCPLLFTEWIKWVVSAGVAAGYGAMLLRQFRRRRAHRL